MPNFVSAILNFSAQAPTAGCRSGNSQIQAGARWTGAELTRSRASLTKAAAVTLSSCDPIQLSLLEEHGYELVTAANGHEGLRLFMSRPVDAIVLEYHLGLLAGVTIANEIKQVRPKVPIVMLADHVDLPGGALKSVDALVAKSAGPPFLLAIVHFVLAI